MFRTRPRLRLLAAVICMRATPALAGSSRAVGACPDDRHQPPVKRPPFRVDAEAATNDVDYPMGEKERLWDGFSPVVTISRFFQNG
jgi:hypothetical protein